MKDLVKAMCLNKRRISTLARAERRAKHQSEKTHEAIEAYSCPFCGSYHTGHKKVYDVNQYLKLKGNL